MVRAVDPEHPFVHAIVGHLGELRADGTFSDIALTDLEEGLKGLPPEALADALWHALVFGAFIDAKFTAVPAAGEVFAVPGGDGAASQLLSLVEKHALRLPADAQRELQSLKASAGVIGASTSSLPVGASPAPEGSLRGGMAARFASIKKP